MTFWELFFENLNLFFGLVVLVTLLVGFFLTISEPGSGSLLDYLSIFVFSFVFSLVICGVGKIAVTAWDYKNQTIVDIGNTSIRKAFTEAGLNCLLKPHDAYHRVKASSHNEFPSSVIFRDKTLIFFNLDSIHPKQSFKKIEAACLEDLSAIKEQKFLNSVSKGGEK